MEAFCIASGPSLTSADCELVRQWRFAREDRRVFVTNNTHELCPWADTLFAGDSKWIMAHGAEGFRGERMTAKQYPGWESFPSGVHWYQNSGAAIVALAMHRGARRVFLLGYDVQKTGGKTHWHGSHTAVLPDGRRLKDATNMAEWSDKFSSLATEAKARRVEVINCTRETALRCFKRRPLEACLAEPAPVD